MLRLLGVHRAAAARLQAGAARRWAPGCAAFRQTQSSAVESDASAAPAATPAAPPALKTVLLYESRPSPYVTAAVRLGKLQGLLGTGAAGWSIWSQIAEFPSFDAWAGVVLGALELEPGFTTPNLYLPLFFAMSGAIGQIIARKYATAHVVKLEATMPADAPAIVVNETATALVPLSQSPDPWQARNKARAALAASVTPEATQGHTIAIYTPGVWDTTKRHVTRVPRTSIECAAPGTKHLSFRVVNDMGRAKPFFLFPLPDWRSGNLAYLRALLLHIYTDAREKPPPPDVEAIMIEGFGPYRPAQFADHTHAAAIAMAERAPALVAAAGAGVLEEGGSSASAVAGAAAAATASPAPFPYVARRSPRRLPLVSPAGRGSGKKGDGAVLSSRNVRYQVGEDGEPASGDASVPFLAVDLITESASTGTRHASQDRRWESFVDEDEAIDVDEAAAAAAAEAAAAGFAAPPPPSAAAATAAPASTPSSHAATDAASEAAAAATGATGATGAAPKDPPQHIADAPPPTSMLVAGGAGGEFLLPWRPHGRQREPPPPELLMSPVFYVDGYRTSAWPASDQHTTGTWSIRPGGGSGGQEAIAGKTQAQLTAGGGGGGKKAAKAVVAAASSSSSAAGSGTTSGGGTVAVVSGSPTPSAAPPARILLSGSPLPATAKPVPVPGTPLYIHHGTVWTAFKPSAPMTLQERRQREHAHRAEGATRVPLDKLPAPGVPANLLPDGGVHRPRLGDDAALGTLHVVSAITDKKLAQTAKKVGAPPTLRMP